MNTYLEYLVGLGLSDKTITAYTKQVRRALSWCNSEGIDLREIRPSEMRRLSEQWPNTYSSRGQVRCALLHYWEMNDVTGPARAINVPPAPRSRWKGLEPDEVRNLLGVARSDWPRGAAVYLGVYLGLRREEIAGLRWSWFDPDLSWVRIQGKGDRYRDLPVHPRLQEVLAPNRWPGDFVFPGRLGGHVSPATVSKWVGEIGRLAGLGHIHPHQLRHTSGGHVNDETEDIYIAQAWLGHANVHTTETYSRVRRDRLLKAMWSLDWELA